MSHYMLHSRHQLEDHQQMMDAYAAYDTPLKGQGKTFLCYGCPTEEPGEHGAFIEIDADDESKALVMLPEVQRPGTSVYLVETLPLDDD